MRYAFFATAGLCAVALVGLIVLFQEVAAPAPGSPRATTTRLPLRRILLYPHFPAVVALLFIAQFLDRGLSLLIPLQVAHMPGLDNVAATAGTLVSAVA